MLYKTGDSVLISPKRVRVMNSNGEADIYLNTVMTIVETRPSAYRMQEDNGRWSWDDTCIVRKTSNIGKKKKEEKKNMLYKTGDSIILKSSEDINSVESDLWFNNQKDVEPLKDKIANKIYTICSAGYNYYRLTAYTHIPEEWIAGLVLDNPYSNDKYNKGDVVKIKACLFSIYNSGGLCKLEIDLNTIIDLADKCFTIRKKDERGYAVVESPYWIPESWIEKVIEKEKAIDIPDNIIEVKKILDSGKKAYVKNCNTGHFHIIEGMTFNKKKRTIHANFRRTNLNQAKKNGYTWEATYGFEVFSERFKVVSSINNKYNVGDTVNIIKDLKADVFYSGTTSCERMTTYEKKDRVIKEVTMRGEYIISDLGYLWGEDMFEEKSSDLSPNKNFGYRIDFPFDIRQEYKVSVFSDTDSSKKVENENYTIKKIQHTRLKSERVKSKEYTPKTGLYKKVKY